MNVICPRQKGCQEPGFGITLGREQQVRQQNGTRVRRLIRGDQNRTAGTGADVSAGGKDNPEGGIRAAGYNTCDDGGLIFPTSRTRAKAGIARDLPTAATPSHSQRRAEGTGS